MEVNLLPSTSMEISIEVNLLLSIEVGGSFHGRKLFTSMKVRGIFHGSRWKVAWK